MSVDNQEVASSTAEQMANENQNGYSQDGASSASQGDNDADSLAREATGGSTESKKDEKERKKREKKEKKLEEKQRKKEEKDAKKGRLHMDGMMDKAIRMLFPITREGRKTLNASIKDQSIPSALIRTAKGLAFLSIAKIGLVCGVQGGMGILVCRKPDGSWSAPCAYQTGGVSCGVLIGASVVDLLLIINTDEQLKTLTSKGMVKLGGDLEVTVGPLGRNAQAAVAAGRRGVAGCYAYSFSKGVYGGISLDGGGLWPYSGENTRFYGREVSMQDIFLGEVEVPECHKELLENFQASLARMSELTVSRRRKPDGTSVTDDGTASSRDGLDTAEDEAILTYFKERGEADTSSSA